MAVHLLLLYILWIVGSYLEREEEEKNKMARTKNDTAFYFSPYFILLYFYPNQLTFTHFTQKNK